ncbi:Membrane metallo-endopeptidase-like 1 [Mycena venus]|uniref:Membrane metallo-endopeptidase-like 1 n=1 Tax=Mycena venus TaxID=2733690 RepID=A0A8H6YPG5_9AGAR|nr:Membrane metallo-endopeptidase-like 1 [Mycena venus]
MTWRSKTYKYLSSWTFFTQLLILLLIRSYQPIRMQFKVTFIVSALLVAAAPVLGADFVWFSGAGCSGSVIARSPGVTKGQCVFLSNGGSAKSISYSGVPNHANFFESGGKHDVCSNGPTIVTSGGSGCATGPAGFNLESFNFS